ncbi:DNA cytosine methyltransferase [Paraburkholderia terrae]|uniref:DNA cytosine methyltransferase n=1 Tax=Paraburkholderia terrae TaxID=311230 RepID=UPI001EE31302|nr:DNA cytosine methyltransferase [Paraburkholderia terrae]GJH00250.1 DNA cytosine methyltransferase [Paraburkholderia terrae]
MKGAYYNEIDPHAAAWLRNLIAAGHIAPGDVDERSIEDVKPDDVRGYAQCHWFAGIGVWSYALRRAGWPDDRPVWSGSCPCQPFSAAGEGLGFADERHLWPYWHWLIRECRPSKIFGEQVASKDANPWLDLVSTDLEGLGFAVGALAFPSAGIGAPHIRDRTYFVADADYARPQGWWGVQERATKRSARARGMARSVDDASCIGPETRQRGNHGKHDGIESPSTSAVRIVGDAKRSGRARRGELGIGAAVEPARIQPVGVCADDSLEPGPTNGFWSAADWIFCRDGKFRPVEPGTQPLADGTPARVGRLRAYGNAICAEAAVAFIRSADEAMKEGAALYHPGFRSSVVVAN